MKKVVFTLFMAFSAILSGNAQAPWQATWIDDTVSLAAGVNQDVFYSLANGTVRNENNKNWHLAFAMSPIGDSAAIWANHQSGNNFTKVFNIHKGANQFASVVLADTASAQIMYNNDRGWYNGAFNGIPSSNVFNFGWGTYNQSTHNVYGDSVFIVRAQGNYYKFFVDSLDGFNTKWYFTIENLSTPGAPTTHMISKTPNYTNRLFAYFNLATLADTNREPVSSTWDLWFGRYTTDAQGSGQGTNNNVIGTFINKGVKAAKASIIHVDTAYDQRNNYPLDSVLNTIGYNWKTFDLNNNSWFCSDSVSYFVQDKNSALWQIQFLGYGGTPTGLIDFRKRLVWPLTVSHLPAAIQQIAIAPNPANNNFNLVVDAKQSEKTKLSIFDLHGKLLQTAHIQLQSGLNAYQISTNSLPSGLYMIHLQGADWTVQDKLSIIK